MSWRNSRMVTDDKTYARARMIRSVERYKKKKVRRTSQIILLVLFGAATATFVILALVIDW